MGFWEGWALPCRNFCCIKLSLWRLGSPLVAPVGRWLTHAGCWPFTTDHGPLPLSTILVIYCYCGCQISQKRVHPSWSNIQNLKGEKHLWVEEPLQYIPNLVVKLYCSDNIVGEVLKKQLNTRVIKLKCSTPLILIIFQYEDKRIEN